MCAVNSGEEREKSEVPEDYKKSEENEKRDAWCCQHHQNLNAIHKYQARL